MASITWIVILVLLAVFAFYATRMAKRAKDEDLHDSGLAIVEFGRAFPQEAIRSLHTTADGRAVFVRLHDNKAGFMRNMRSHYACHMIEPGTVRVRDLPSGRGFAIEFLDAPFHNGEFTFATPMEAAEVSLWLLGNYVNSAELDPPPGAVPTV
ncbi:MULTISPECIES: hypothetical protein [Alphaproteobacteria]|uniref:Uncharacterized protein n=2 Tax=Alphaproteobacteria TaxID=28211 RepID=A0A512HHG5_9HYPH|nr:hypothetical protein [Sphingomonas psychrolutea]GEO84894.1 hypothetical protein RNA01_18260 [Ciceribacter naphthalenivorans]GLR22828.1 hypothetical protein GCM10007920_26160 [Ciceribacter naphthalenivorans]GLT05684.1 hypothetical protein GCM10007926_26160 [Sphingomonas psychrolutea]